MADEKLGTCSAHLKSDGTGLPRLHVKQPFCPDWREQPAQGEPRPGCEKGDKATERECYECGGEGYITAECFEDTCCCADPETEHGIIPCPNCRAGRSDV